MFALCPQLIFFLLEVWTECGWIGCGLSNPSFLLCCSPSCQLVSKTSKLLFCERDKGWNERSCPPITSVCAPLGSMREGPMGGVPDCKDLVLVKLWLLYFVVSCWHCWIDILLKPGRCQSVMDWVCQVVKFCAGWASQWTREQWGCLGQIELAGTLH